MEWDTAPCSLRPAFLSCDMAGYHVDYVEFVSYVIDYGTCLLRFAYLLSRAIALGFLD